MRPTRPDISSHWDLYKSTGDPMAREKLIEHYYVSLVKPVANKMAHHLSSAVDRNDLVSYGAFGLIDAIEKFDQGKGVKFETYAVSRIRGAILDELRSLDWVPRGVRSKAKDFDRAFEQLEKELGRVPESSEIADRLGVNAADLRQVRVASLTALESPQGEDGSLGDFVRDITSDPESVALVSEITERVSIAVSSLPERSRVIIALYYIEQMTLGEIGEALGVTESRVCQLHGSVLKSLQEALAAA